jgi:bacterioferritin
MPDNNNELVDGLNEQLNREVTTFLRYIQQAAKIKGAEWKPAREMYLNEVADEVGHAQYLANQIVMLGGTPKIDPDLAPPPDDVRSMLQRDMEQEQEDVKHYAHLASLAAADGLMAIKLQMEEQAADEDRHGQEMRRLLG